MLRKHPGFTITAVITLAFGIGANTATFSILNGVLLRPVSGVTDPGRLVTVRRSMDGRTGELTHPRFQEYRDQAETFSGMVAWQGATVHLHAGEVPIPLDAAMVTSGYFSVLGVQVELGRDFAPEETRVPNTFAVAILSHALWESHYGADPEILGRQIRLNDTQFTVVGIASREFRGVRVDEPLDLWLPLMMEAAARPSFPMLDNNLFTLRQVIARLQPGVTFQQAQAELATLATGIEPPAGATGQGPRIVLEPVIRRSLKDVAGFLMGLGFMVPAFGGAALVLAIVCANLASLLLARYLVERKEIALQLALGVARSRLVLRMVGESVMLAVVGSMVGLPLASWGTAVAKAQLGSQLDVGLDHRVALFTGSLAVLVGVAFGLTPALLATGRNLVQDLKDLGSGPHRSRLRQVLVAGQIALSLVLLTGAALFARTMHTVTRQDVGFETEHLYLVPCDLDKEGYTNPEAQIFYQELTDRLRALPGVQAVSRASALPLDRGFLSERWGVLPEGVSTRDSTGVRVEFNRITPGYFATVGLRLMLGRDFTAVDGGGAAPVTVVNETLARQLWPQADPLGRTLRYVTVLFVSEPLEVVGVVHDARNVSKNAQARPEMFVPLSQRFVRDEYVLIRVDEGVGDVSAMVREEVSRLDAEMPPMLVESVAQRRIRGHSYERFQARVTGFLAVLALLLSAIGLFGALSFQVSHQLRDTGVRMALGAEPGQVLREVLREGLTLALPGVGAGLLGALALARLLEGLLFGVAPWDPVSFVAAATVLVGVTILVSWLPAYRATKVDPANTLRYE